MEDPELPVGYILNGSQVYYENTYGKMECNKDADNGCFICEGTSKISTQNLDCAVAGNSDKMKGRSADLWANISHDVQEEYQGIVTKTYTCPYSNFSYRTTPDKFAWCSDGNGTLVFSHSFLGGNIPAKTIWWNETGTATRTVQVYYNDWNNINHLFSKQTLNGKDYFIISNINWVQNTTKKVKLCFDTQFQKLPNGKWGIDEKVDIFCKRSSDTISQALSSGNMFIVDPWVNASYSYKRNISFDNYNMKLPFLLNATTNNTGFTFNNSEKNSTQFVWGITPDTLNMSIYYNNNSDYFAAYNNETYAPMEVSYGNGTDFKPTDVWDSNYLAVWHFDNNSGYDSTKYKNHQTTGVVNRARNRTAMGLSQDSRSICMPDNDAFDSTNFTIEAVMLIKSATTGSVHRTILDHRSGIMFWYTNAGGSFVFEGIFSGATRAFTAPYTMKVNQWQYIVFSYQTNGSATIYVDGNIVPGTWDVQPSTAPDNTGNTFNIFEQSTSCGIEDRAQALMDEWRFSNIVRNSSYVRAQYLSMQNKFALEQTNIPPISLVISGLNCTNGTAFKTGFNWTENVSSCKVACTGSTGLNISFNGTEGIGTEDNSYDSNDTWFVQLVNSTFSTGIASINIPRDKVLINYSGTWNITAQCTDGSNNVGTSIQWSIPWGTVNVTLVSPNTNISVQNGTTQLINTRVGCIDYECANITHYLDPLVIEKYIRKLIT